MYSIRNVLTACVVVGLPGSCIASWHQSCRSGHTAQWDPITSPGKASKYVNNVVGPSISQEASCSTCEYAADKSNYWTPQLYYEHSNGEFEAVKSPSTKVHYMNTDDDAVDTVPFPPGFRMSSGDELQRSYNDAPISPSSDLHKSDRINFTCLDNGLSSSAFDEIANECTASVTAQIHFQSCWNGLDTYKRDNSHVAYLSELSHGSCPQDYPLRLMHIVLEVSYALDSVVKTEGRYVFAQGDTTGFGMKGSFLNGWDDDVQAAAITQCKASDDLEAECTILIRSTESPDPSCHRADDVNTVDQLRDIRSLPGCITITPGPEAATDDDMTCQNEDTVADAKLELRHEKVHPNHPKAPHHPVRPITMPINHHSVGGASTKSCSKTKHVSTIKSTFTTRSSSTIYKTSPVASKFSSHTISVTGTAPRVSATTLVTSKKVNATTTAPPGPVRSNPSVYNGFVAVGCYAEGTSGRALDANSFSATNLTVYSCLDFCERSGTGFAGLEGGDQCYCGTGLSHGSVSANINSCNLGCSGNANQNCGGTNFFYLYQSG